MRNEANLIAIRDFSSAQEADIVKSALEAFGIECVVSSDDCGGQRPSLAMTQGVRILVRSADVRRAEEVLTHREPV